MSASLVAEFSFWHQYRERVLGLPGQMQSLAQTPPEGQDLPAEGQGAQLSCCSAEPLGSLSRGSLGAVGMGVAILSAFTGNYRSVETRLIGDRQLLETDIKIKLVSLSPTSSNYSKHLKDHYYPLYYTET